MNPIRILCALALLLSLGAAETTAEKWTALKGEADKQGRTIEQAAVKDLLAGVDLTFLEVPQLTNKATPEERAASGKITQLNMYLDWLQARAAGKYVYMDGILQTVTDDMVAGAIGKLDEISAARKAQGRAKR